MEGGWPQGRPQRTRADFGASRLSICSPGTSRDAPAITCEMSLLSDLKHRLHGDTDPLDFSPGLAAVRERMPSPLPRLVLYAITGLFAIALAWAAFGSVDVVAVAEGKLVPQTYVKIVQPVEQGTVKEILVQEGDLVRAGQVLMRMDAQLGDADRKAIEADLALRRLHLRRIDAELSGKPFATTAVDPPDLARQTTSLYRANRQSLEDAIAQERAALSKARQDLAAARAIEEKLRQLVPIYRDREQAFVKLGKDGFAGNLMVMDHQRERIEKEQELLAQRAAAESAKATQQQSERRIDQLTSTYRQQLQRERTEHLGEIQKQEQELAKRVHRDTLLELKAPQAGMIKDLATHTAGTVVSPGTILMTLVPTDEPLRAEIWVGNEDIGFVRPQQAVKVKVATYPFQKYGLLNGTVLTVSADASDANGDNQEAGAKPQRNPSTYKALVSLDRQALLKDGKTHALAPGMAVSGEILLMERTILEYLTSPLQKTTMEAARER